MDVKNILNIEKCVKEEKMIINEIAFLRPDLSREIVKVSFGIKYFLNSGEIIEEYYDEIYKENLQEGTSYYPNSSCNSYEEIENITHVASNRDRIYNELIAGLTK